MMKALADLFLNWFPYATRKETIDFLWVRAAFVRLLEPDIGPVRARAEAWTLAIAWANSGGDVQVRVVHELKRDLGR